MPRKENLPHDEVSFLAERQFGRDSGGTRGPADDLAVVRPPRLVHSRAMTSSSQPGETRMESLYQLVLDLFSVEEFRRWLRHGTYADILVELPGALATGATFVEETLASLERRGLIDRTFFDRMTKVRERKAAAIAMVAARWHGADRASAASQRIHGETPVRGERLEVRRMLERHFPTDAEFEAFGHDSFPDTARQWSAGMDRLQKTTLLLNREGATEVRARMLAYCGAQE